MQLQLLVALCCAVVVRATVFSDDIWRTWKRQHGKVYNDMFSERAHRRQFYMNLDVIAQHNLKYDVGLVSFSMGLNQFSDLSSPEFKRRYLREVIVANSTKQIPNHENSLGKLAGPSGLDWRQKGLVTKVKDQGECHSCWAFATTGAVEGQYIQLSNKSIEFSEQQLVDCSGEFGNYGCDGGFLVKTYEYIHKYGLETEADYPYVARDQKCNYHSQKTVVTVKSMKAFPSGDEVQLKSSVATYGPVAAALDAQDDFQHYKQGVFTSDACSSTKVNHAVLIVGYGTEAGKDYWIVKNSWSAQWGEAGYFRIARNQGNMCGIASVCSVPLLSK